MAFSRCTYRPEVLAAVFRRPALRIPAFGFGFRGAGESYETTAADPLPGFRHDDQVTIRRAEQANGRELDWNRTDGLLRAAADELLVSLRAGDWVAYDIVVPAPARFQVIVALAGSATRVPQARSLDVSIDGDALGAEDADASTVRVTTGTLTAGRHVVRLTGLMNETLVRSIEVVPG
jgi:hypothetical protein